MTERDFCYWLQGYFEIAEPVTLTSQQVAVIKEHLQLVFHKVTEKGLKADTWAKDYVEKTVVQEIDWEKIKKSIEKKVDDGVAQFPNYPRLDDSRPFDITSDKLCALNTLNSNEIFRPWNPELSFLNNVSC